MNTRKRTVRAAVVLAAAGALLLTGCGEEPVETRAVNHSSAAAPSAAPDKPAPSVSSAAPAVSSGAPAAAAAPKPAPEQEEVPVENVPTELPPGDPGLDAPSVPDPGVPEHDREHEEPAQTTVPAEAMLDAQTVSAVLGGDWQQADAVTLEPVSGPGAVAERTVAFSAQGAASAEGAGGTPGELAQTVTTYTSLAAADRAVTALADQLAGQGWTTLANPRLGTASVALRSGDGTQTAVVLSAEGVTATLVGTDSATSNRARWSSLLDLALGSSCAAAPHGCH